MALISINQIEPDASYSVAVVAVLLDKEPTAVRKIAQLPCYHMNSRVIRYLGRDIIAYWNSVFAPIGGISHKKAAKRQANAMNTLRGMKPAMAGAV